VTFCLSTGSAAYVLPRTRTRFGERGFFYSGPAAWNTLPSDLHDITDTSTFRKRLKNVLFDRAYHGLLLALLDVSYYSSALQILRWLIDWLIDWYCALEIFLLSNHNQLTYTDQVGKYLHRPHRRRWPIVLHSWFQFSVVAALLILVSAFAVNKVNGAKEAEAMHYSQRVTAGFPPNYMTLSAPRNSVIPLCNRILLTYLLMWTFYAIVCARCFTTRCNQKLCCGFIWKRYQ